MQRAIATLPGAGSPAARGLTSVQHAGTVTPDPGQPVKSLKTIATGGDLACYRSSFADELSVLIYSSCMTPAPLVCDGSDDDS
ncbi:hypothetical protein LIA77_02242 [Sarocladium implicatum]|nr:hypothetical protein LIA77_02242 [Sarocladium implicatum]